MVRAVACEARGPGFNSCSDQMVFSLLGYKEVGLKWIQTGPGCGAVGRAVASNTRDPWFESRHRQNFERIYLSIAIQKRRK